MFGPRLSPVCSHHWASSRPPLASTLFAQFVVETKIRFFNGSIFFFSFSFFCMILLPLLPLPSASLSLSLPPWSLPRVSSVCLKSGFGQTDQRCGNSITVPDHMPPPSPKGPSIFLLSDVLVVEVCLYLLLGLVFKAFILSIPLVCVCLLSLAYPP